MSAKVQSLLILSNCLKWEREENQVPKICLKSPGPGRGRAGRAGRAGEELSNVAESTPSYQEVPGLNPARTI